ncbi:MAG: N-acetylglucosamine-6-phosphate deacetylase [Chitinophagaceae bacterium]
MRKAYTQAKIFDGEFWHSGQALLTDNGRVQGILSEAEIPSDAIVENLQGNWLSPAFIDLQIYGGNGKLFSQDTTVEAIAATYDYCRAGGAGYFYITLATNTIEKFLEAIEIVRDYWKRGGKGLLGLHLEGPYLNKAKRGAHPADLIKPPTRNEVARLLKAGEGVIKMMTIAPECCDAAISEQIMEQGILVSAGHSNATYAEASAAFDQGIPAATHLYNAMSPLQHRAPGMVGAIFDHKEVKSSIICDGIHVDYAAARIAKKIMGSRLFYITDAVTASTGGLYTHLLKNDHYELPDGTLSGSALTMAQCVNNGVQHLGISWEESLRMATCYPAHLIRDRKVGRLQKGYEAGLVVLNDQGQVQKLLEA